MTEPVKFRSKESYSSLSMIKQCPYQYKLRYIDGNYKQQESIALDIGVLCHKVLEIQRDPAICFSKDYSKNDLLDVLEEGYEEKDSEGKIIEKIQGLNFIKDKYFEEYLAINPKSGLNYVDKMNNFVKYLRNYEPDKRWLTIATEFPFSFKYRGFNFEGKIDRIDIDTETAELKVTDYKTANKVYEDKDLKTPMQMFVYALAIKKLFGRFPTEFEYDFVLLGEKSQAMSKGWEKRGQKSLDKLIDDRYAYYNANDFPPKPTPLCYYCPYCKEECEYYSLWTPTNKTFAVNKKYEPFSEQVGVTEQKQNNFDNSQILF